MKTNLDMTQMENKKLAFNMLNAPETRLSDMVGKSIHATDYVIDNIEIVDKDSGEVMETSRLVIRDNQGRTYHTMARGLLESFNRILAVFGDSWGEGFDLMVNQVNTSSGKRTYIFEIV